MTTSLLTEVNQVEQTGGYAVFSGISISWTKIEEIWRFIMNHQRIFVAVHDLQLRISVVS
jgi:hypothetical protein